MLSAKNIAMEAQILEFISKDIADDMQTTNEIREIELFFKCMSVFDFPNKYSVFYLAYFI